MLYAIVDATTLRGRDPVPFARACIRGGARALQWRAKDLPDDHVLTTGRALADACAEAGIPFFVNDRADLAAILGAHVHVGQGDLPVAEARALLGAGRMVGLSTHTAEQVDAARAVRPDMLGFGPVFQSGTKQGHADTTGTALLSDAVKRAGGVPVIAIGGITVERAADCIRAGATYVAVIGALAAAEDVEGMARAFAASCAAARGTA